MNREIKLIAAGLTLAIAGGAISVGAYKVLDEKEPQKIVEYQEIPNQLTGSKYDYAARPSFEAAAELSLNGVVHIKTQSTAHYNNIDPFYQFFYGNRTPAPQQMRSSGSGVIISEDGYIVTNNHVVESADEIEITLNDKKNYTAELIGTDPNTDLALLKIDAESLPFVQYGNSDQINVGEWVLAVGNPFNLTSTVTAGIVSAKGRDINILRNDPYTGMSAIESFIQTDAAVNPGNSGGALVNTKGELIGINAAIKSNTGSFTGYSFAIPVNIVKKVVNDLKEFGTVQRAFIGVSIRNIDEQIAEQIGTNDMNGVYVSGVTENGAAADAGIESGDVIKKIGSKEVSDVPELQEQLSQFRPGDKIIVTVEREEKPIEIPITLKNLKGDLELVKKEDNRAMKLLGAKLIEVDAKEAKELGISGGTKVVELYNGKLRSVGVKEGYIITKINHKKVTNLDDVNTIIKGNSGGILIEGIYENGRKEFYGFGI